MRSILKQPSVALPALALSLSLSLSEPAQAHLMVAQHGTLNIVEGSAFMVLSLPVSAFEGIDDNNDGEVSMIEFNSHRAAIVESVKQNVILSDENGDRPLRGIMLSPVMPHDAVHPATVASQVVVMGSFTLDDADSALRFQVGLYGERIEERSLEITATRRSDNRKQVLELTPATSTGLFFPIIESET